MDRKRRRTGDETWAMGADMQYVERWTEAVSRALAPIRVRAPELDIGRQIRRLRRKAARMDRARFSAEARAIRTRISEEKPRNPAGLLEALDRTEEEMDAVDGAMRESLAGALFEPTAASGS